MNKLISKLVMFIFIPISLSLIYVAGSWGLADVYYRPALNEIRNWIFGKSEINDERWDKLKLSLSKAQQLDPTNPYIYENLGIALEARFSKMEPGDLDARVYREQALEHYRTSAFLRPTWPYAWNSIMTVKFRLGEIDHEFFTAFNNAERLGRWEPDIQRMLVDIGLINWLQFPASERKYLLDIVSRSLEKQPIKTLEIVNKNGLLDVICLLNKDKEDVNKYCNQYKI